MEDYIVRDRNTGRVITHAASRPEAEAILEMIEEEEWESPVYERGWHYISPYDCIKNDKHF